ncbi:hypothetical protein ACAF76_012810 [Brevibacillus sp. TJ4]|uniref:hypothetical protein n=1 Tax=Brevibacillus sp. TJ4 TaxID=3234853 RepID=UPI0037D611FC
MLASFYQQFEDTLHRDGRIAQSKWRTYAGQRFFYVNSALCAPELTICLLEAAGRLSHGTRLKPECIYVRSDDCWHVYRFRFRVPDEKQFCCGNLCDDCFLLRDSAGSA